MPRSLVSTCALSVGEQASEALLMGLRLVEGLDLAAFENRFGKSRWSMVSKDALATYEELGFVWSDGDRIGVRPKGLPVLNTLIATLVEEHWGAVAAATMVSSG